MDVKEVVSEKPVTITNNGMITIPALLRKKYYLKDGDKVLVIEDEGTLKIILLSTDEEIRKNSYTYQEMQAQMERSQKEEIEKELK
jgi:AbrB family looped-hinge helix DNA binding protein